MPIKANKFVVLGKQDETANVEQFIPDPEPQPPAVVEGRKTIRSGFVSIGVKVEQEQPEPVKGPTLADVKANAQQSAVVRNRFQKLRELRKIRKERRILARQKRILNPSAPVPVNPKYVENTSILYTESSYLSDLGLTEG